MSETSLLIAKPVGNGVKSDSVDTFKIQILLNAARVRINMPPIGEDGQVGPETIGAIYDFQKQAFGKGDGRVDPGYNTIKRLVDIYLEPKLVSPKTYTVGKSGMYQVTVGIDGRIIVQRNDWVTKYSAAIYNDYVHIDDFGRYENGQMTRLVDPDLIRAGEVIYHIPTFEKYMGDKMGPIPSPLPMSNDRRKKVIADAINHDFNLKGDYGPKLVNKLAEYVQDAGFAAELLSYGGPILEAIAERVALVAIVFETYTMHRDFLNVSDKDLRMYGMRAAAYASTAWAFNRVIPTSSPKVRSFHKVTKSKEQMERADRFWKQSAEAAVRSQERYAEEKFGGSSIPKEKKWDAWKLTLRVVSDETPSKLCKIFMKELGEKSLEKTIPQTKRIWEAGLSILYPD